MFFGGKMGAVEKRTRVRAQVIFHALGNLIRDSERVLIMGHAKPDMDAMGAAIGVLKAVRLQQRPGISCLDDRNPSIELLMEAVSNHDELKDRIIGPERALQLADPEPCSLSWTPTSLRLPSSPGFWTKRSGWW